MWFLEGTDDAFKQRTVPRHLLGRSVFGDGLGALRDGVLGQFTRQQKAYSCLDFPRGDGGTLVVVSKTRCFSCNAFKDVIHERVHDGHSLGGNTSVRVDLLEHLVDVNAVGFLPPAFLLLVALGDGLLGLASLLGSLSGGFGWHTDVTLVQFAITPTAIFDSNLSKAVAVAGL